MPCTFCASGISQCLTHGCVALSLAGLGLASPLDGDLWKCTNVQHLEMGFNNLTSISPAIGNLTGIKRIALQGNMLTSLPDEFGQLVRLESMTLADNDFTTLSPWIEKLTSPHLTQIFVHGNDRLVSYPKCNMALCSPYFSTSSDGSMCESCLPVNGGPTDIQYSLSVVALIGLGIGGGMLLWKVAGADWRPDCQSGASCLVHFGRANTAHTAAEVWLEMVDVRLAEDAGSVRLDHATSEIVRGDEVKITSDEHTGRTLCCTKFSLLNCQGSVVDVDGTSARVSVHGHSGIKKLPLHDLELLPSTQTHEPGQSRPALCFCLGSEWCSAVTFTQDITRVLGERSGVALPVAAVAQMSDEHKQNLTAGCAFVVCGQAAAATAGHRWLVDVLKINDESLVLADAAGQVESPDDNSRVLRVMEDFLVRHSLT